MDTSRELTSRIMVSLSALAPDEPSEALNGVIASALKTMTIYRVLEIRCAIASGFDPELPIVASALDVIDGQIALREIAGASFWR